MRRRVVAGALVVAALVAGAVALAMPLDEPPSAFWWPVVLEDGRSYACQRPDGGSLPVVVGIGSEMTYFCGNDPPFPLWHNWLVALGVRPPGWTAAYRWEGSVSPDESSFREPKRYVLVEGSVVRR